MTTLVDVIQLAIEYGECRRMTELATMLDMPADLVESAQFNEDMTEKLLEAEIEEFAATLARDDGTTYARNVSTQTLPTSTTALQ